MKALQRNFYFFTAVLALSSCASFENLTDDRTRAEDDEMYWNGKELFYDNSVAASASVGGDDYYDPNSASRSNSLNGGTNPRATFNPISGWQLSYGLNAFSNYNNVFGMGLGYSPFNSYGGYGNYGYNPYGYNGYNSYGYNPYSSYNGFGGGYGYNPYGYGLGGLGWGGYGYGNGWYGNGNGWYGNGGGWGGSSGNGETVNVTHHHRRPSSVGTGNSSTYGRGVLQKSLVQPIAETSRTPQPVAPARSGSNNNYSSPTYASPSRSTPTYTQPSTSGPTRTTPNTAPSQTSPSRQTPSNSSPSHTAPAPSPSRSTPSPSHTTPSHSSPAPSRSTPSQSSSPSRSTSPSRRP